MADSVEEEWKGQDLKESAYGENTLKQKILIMNSLQNKETTG